MCHRGSELWDEVEAPNVPVLKVGGKTLMCINVIV